MITLHGYWRSSAAYRVRLALAYKSIPCRQAPLDLRAGAERGADYLQLNPQGLVPTLETPDGVLTQSLAILEWIEETYPTPPLLPATPALRARARAIAAAIACDIHPLNNLRVLKRLRADGRDEASVTAWIRHWIGLGFAAIEATLPPDGPAIGDHVSLAEICLLPQRYNAERFGLDLAPYPRLLAVTDAVAATAWARAAHPAAQPDADP